MGYETDAERLDRHIKQYDQAKARGDNKAAAAEVDYSQNDYESTVSTREAATDAAATAAAVAAAVVVEVATVGTATPLVATGLMMMGASGTAAATVHGLTNSQSGATEIARQGLIGAASAVPVGKGAQLAERAAAGVLERTGSKVLAAGTQGAVKGGTHGAVQGGIEGGVRTATESNTWKDGQGLFKVLEAAGWGMVSGTVVGGVAGGGATAAGAAQKAFQSTRKFEVNSQGLPLDYIKAVQSSGVTKKDVAAYYANLEKKGINYRALIEDFVKTNPHGVNLAEAHAIFGYTTKLFYSELNRGLRSGSVSADSELVKLLNSGLKKMPLAHSVQYRGILPGRQATELAGMGSGKSIHFPSYGSSSNAPTPEFWDHAGIRVKINGSRARDISALSFGVHFIDKINPKFVRAQQESLFLPGVNLKVVATDGRNIDMEQRSFFNWASNDRR